MANISTFLSAIMQAVYGEDVRTSIHDAIDIINKVAEHAIAAGTDVTDENSPTTGYFDTSLYINTVTDDLWQCTGSAWTKKGNIRGVGIQSIDLTAQNVLVDTYTITFTDALNPIDFNVTNGRGIVSIERTAINGLVDTYTITYNDTTTDDFEITNGRGIVSFQMTDRDGLVDTYTFTYNDGTTDTLKVNNGVNGNKWYRGVEISGKAQNPTVYALSGITLARVDDYYMNPSEGAIYYCVREGDPDHAEWVYDFTLAGGGSGVSTWADLLNKPFTYVGNAGIEVTGTSPADYTLKAKVDGSYISFDANGAITLNSDIVALLYKYYAGHFRTDSVTNMVYLADDIIKRLPNTVPTSAEKGMAPVVQADGTVKWAKVGAGFSAILKIFAEKDATVTVVKGTENYTVTHDPTTEIFECEVDSIGTYTVKSTLNGDTVTKHPEVAESGKIYTVTAYQFQATINVSMPSGAKAYATKDGVQTETITTSGNITVGSVGAWEVHCTYGDNSAESVVTKTIASEGDIQYVNFNILFATITVTIDGFEAPVTVTVTDGDLSYNLTSISTTTFRIPKTGTWNLSAVDAGGESRNVTPSSINIANLTDEKTASVRLSTWGIATWLGEAGISSSATTFDEIDEADLRKAMTVHASADYLADWCNADSSMLDDLIASDKAMKWLGLRDYVYDKLSAISGVEDKLLGSEYWERILKDKVPVMTAKTSPYGSVFAMPSTSESVAHQAFDENDSTLWATGVQSSSSNIYIGYNFVNPICVKKVKIHFEYRITSANYRIEASNDNFASSASTKILKDNLTDISSEVIIPLDNEEYFLYYRVFFVSQTSSVQTGRISILQFYGRSLSVSVPKMSNDNTTPYGEAFDSTGRNNSYYVFDGNDSTAWSPTGGVVPNSIGYKFTRKTKIKFLDIYPSRDNGVRVKDFILQGSNTGNDSDYTDLFNGTCQNISGHQYFECDDYEESYIYYRLKVITSWSGSNLDILTLQFYGLDYSERDFAEDGKVKYLYDHGVELEPITADAGISQIAEKRSDILYAKSLINNGTTGRFLANAIDLSNYSIQRAIIANELMSTYIAGQPGLCICDVSNDLFSYRTIEKSDLYANCYESLIDISGNYKPMIASGGIPTTIITVSEWWLEK